jgi:hypothetical protein
MPVWALRDPTGANPEHQPVRPAERPWGGEWLAAFHRQPNRESGTSCDHRLSARITYLAGGDIMAQTDVTAQFLARSGAPIWFDERRLRSRARRTDRESREQFAMPFDPSEQYKKIGSEYRFLSWPFKSTKT